jgi:hypothetical protein
VRLGQLLQLAATAAGRECLADSRKRIAHHKLPPEASVSQEHRAEPPDFLLPDQCSAARTNLVLRIVMSTITVV